MDAKQEKLVLDNRGLVYHLVAKAGIKQYEFDDFISAGTIGLVKAALTYDETKGANFATYAARCISNEVYMYGRMQKKHYNVSYLYDKISTDEDGNELLLYNVIPDSSVHFTHKVETEAIFINVINLVLNELKPIEKIVMLYSISGLDQYKIADKLDISQGYVSRVERKAKSKIKKYLEKPNNLSTKSCCMSIAKGLYSITFPLTDKSVLYNLTTNKVRVEIIGEENVIIQTPAQLEYFFEVAEIISKIEGVA